MTHRVEVYRDPEWHEVRVETIIEPGSGTVQRSQRMIARHLVIGFHETARESELRQYLTGLGLQILDWNDSLRLVRVQLPTATIAGFDEMRRRVEARKEWVRFVEPNFLQESTALPNDPFLHSQSSWGQPFKDTWGLHSMRMEDVWADGNLEREVVVAVMDSGVDIQHPDLAGQIWQNPDETPGNGIDDDRNGKVDDIHGWDFLGRSAGVTDAHGHGTAIAGIIAARHNNGIGIAGVARSARIMALKTSSQTSSPSYATAEAIQYAADKGASVINMSFGSSALIFAMDQAVAYARAKGVIMVASAGNEGLPTVAQFPANFEGVISVGALRHTGERASFSNYGPLVDVMAPGEQVLTLRASGTTGGTTVAEDYVAYSGTSFACPMVAGLAAAIRARHPEFSAEQVQALMQSQALDVGTPDWDFETGHGLACASAVLASRPPAVPNILSPANGDVVYGSVEFRGDIVAPEAFTASLHFRLLNGSEEWFPFAAQQTAGRNVLLGVLDTTGVRDDTYVVRLTVESGGEEFRTYRVIKVGNQLPRLHRVNGVDGSRKSAADLNGDGVPEVIHTPFQGVEAFDGRTGAYLPGWPSSPWSRLPDAGHNSGVPAIGDLDGDGKAEIAIFFAPTNNQWQDSSLQIFRYDGTLTPASFLFHNARTENNGVISPVITDLDQDGTGEIIFVESDGSRAKVQAVTLDRTSPPGWPVELPTGSVTSHGTPAVADVTGDGKPEMAVFTADGNIHLLSHEGRQLPGWPVRHSFDLSTKTFLVFADFDNDGALELFAASDDGKLAVYEVSGSVLAGSWPLQIGRNVTPPAVGDVNGDGVVEIAIGSRSTPPVSSFYQYLIEHTGRVLPGWPQHTSSPLGMPLLLDLNNNGTIDVYNTEYTTTAVAWDASGRPLTELGFPRSTRYYGSHNEIAGDFDSDGLLEISASKYVQGFHWLKLQTPASLSALQHGMIHTTPDRNNRFCRASVDTITPAIVEKDKTGSRLTLKGRGFLPATRVFLGNVECPAETITRESITFLVPPELHVGVLTCTVENVNFGSVPAPSRIVVVTTLEGDDDRDGLSNEWELQNNLNPFDESPELYRFLGQGDTVPGAGDPGSGIPALSTWKSFGTPSLTGSAARGARIGFMGAISAPEGELRGIFSSFAGTTRLHVKEGDSIPSAAEGSQTIATFKSFKTPVFAGTDSYAFIATIQGSGIKRGNDTGIWASGPEGRLVEIAREGGEEPSFYRSVFVSFGSILMQSPERVYFTAKILQNVRTSRVYDALCLWTPNAGVVVVHHGFTSGVLAVPFLATKIQALQSPTGSAGHGRYDDVLLSTVVTYKDRKQSLVNVIHGWKANIMATTHEDLTPGMKALRFGLPSSMPDGFSYSVRAIVERKENKDKPELRS